MANLKILIQDEQTGALRLGLSNPPQKVEGIDLLVQIVALKFLRDGSRSIFAPGEGGGLRAYLGGNLTIDDADEVLADLRLITSQIEKAIKEEQVTTARPAAERLQMLQMINLVAVPGDPRALNMVVAVVNEEQQQTQVTVVV